MTIQSYKMKMGDPACPLLVHVVMPAALEASLKPALMQALPDETLDFYTTAEDAQVRILVESFTAPTRSGTAIPSMRTPTTSTPSKQSVKCGLRLAPLCAERIQLRGKAAAAMQ